MTHVDIGGLKLGLRSWGEGDVPVVFIHGNLASKDWIELAAPLFPAGLKTIGIDWRGCGDSDRPAADADFANYSIAQHAADMIAALDALGISFCHLATHSTGGIIAARMLLAQPERFGRVLHLDPVAPRSIVLPEQAIKGFAAMKAHKAATRAGMAWAASSLFVPESLTSPEGPQLVADAGARGVLFEKIVDQTFSVSDGIWSGTPVGLEREFKLGELAARMGEMRQPQLILWGEKDVILTLADAQDMCAGLPDCRLEVLPGIGHSANLEAPELYAKAFGEWFLAGR